MGFWRIPIQLVFSGFCGVSWSPNNICVGIFSSLCENTFYPEVLEGQVLSSSSKREEGNFRQRTKRKGRLGGGGWVGRRCTTPRSAQMEVKTFPTLSKERAVTDRTSSFQPNKNLWEGGLLLFFFFKCFLRGANYKLFSSLFTK